MDNTRRRRLLCVNYRSGPRAACPREGASRVREGGDRVKLKSDVLSSSPPRIATLAPLSDTQVQVLYLTSQVAGAQVPAPTTTSVTDLTRHGAGLATVAAPLSLAATRTPSGSVDSTPGENASETRLWSLCTTACGSEAYTTSSTEPPRSSRIPAALRRTRPHHEGQRLAEKAGSVSLEAAPIGPYAYVGGKFKGSSASGGHRSAHAAASTSQPP
mmetsp:Transcript_39026/g.78030  ORF Transcript_39026/g.78030 Transcript_39026/m.78030 type:complete len:215 (-) Transcript_39026:412-1056(-)